MAPKAPEARKLNHTFSRFVLRTLGDKETVMHIVIWAWLGETLGQEWLPSLVEFVLAAPFVSLVASIIPEGVDTVLLAANGLGAVVCALATVVMEACEAELAKARKEDDKIYPVSALERTASAFKGGFVAVFTSFLGCVEHTSDLFVEGKNGAGLFVWFVSFVLGPILYAAALLVGRRLGPSFLLRQFRRQWPMVAGDPGKVAVERRILGMKCLVGLVLALATLPVWPPAADGNILHQMWLLPWGWCSAMLACFAGDFVAMLYEAYPPPGKFPELNVTTVVANAAALVLGRISLSVGHSGYLPVVLVMALGRFRGTFGGALSAYGAFTEDVATSVLNGDIPSAVANWGFNAVLLLFFILSSTIPSPF